MGHTGTPLAIIRSCKPSSNPRGHAGQAWEALVEGYQPTDMDVEDDLTNIFNSCVPLSPTEPPISWFQCLEHIVVQLAAMGEPKSDRAVKRHILTKLPQEYDSIQSVLYEKDNMRKKSVTNIKSEIIGFH